MLIGNSPINPPWLWGCAILVQNSRNTIVEDNSVDMTDGGNGICLVQQDRGTGRYGPWVTTGNLVRHNTIVSRSPDRGISGAIADHDAAGMWAGGNRFDGNTYRVPRLTDEHWAWIDGMYGWTDYRRRSGQDATSHVEAEIAP